VGRPALDFATAQLHGTTVDRPSRAKEKPEHRGGRPKYPLADLPPEAKPVWDAIVKQLRRRRTLTPGDGPALTLYCRTFLQWRLACADVEKNGVRVSEERYSREGNPYTVSAPNPFLKISAGLADTLQQYLRDFGLTTKDRTKVEPVSKKDTAPSEAEGTVAYYQKNAEAIAALPSDAFVIPAALDDADFPEPEGGGADGPAQRDTDSGRSEA
jgi:P27 family predicted phage terminase small subunit